MEEDTERINGVGGEIKNSLKKKIVSFICHIYSIAFMSSLKIVILLTDM